MNNNLPVTLNFNDTGGAYVWVQLTELAKTLPNLHEYALVPSYRKNDDGSFTVDGYGLVHRDQVASTEQMERKYGKGNF